MSGSLQGARVLVTRALEDVPPLAALLEARGAEPVALPCIELSPPRDRGPLDGALARLRAGAGWPDWVVIASPHAARRFLAELGAPPAARIAAVGEATAEVLEALGVRDAFRPDGGAGASALVAALAPSLRGRSVLLPRAEESTPELLEGLRAAGAQVEDVTLYRTIPAATADRAAEARLRAGEIDALSFASGSAARGFASLFRGDAGPLSARCAIACMGARCADAVRAAGLHVDAVGDGGLRELVSALEQALQKRAPAGPASP
jgi:uroporphyrinogen-III synthase